MRKLFMVVALVSGLHVDANAAVFGRLRVLKESRHFHPRHILDLGANRGLWTKEAQKVWPGASFFMVEANPAHKPTLASTGVPFAISVLGDEEKNVSMHFGAMGKADTGNSVFPETRNQEMFTPSIVTMRTLDEVLRTNGQGNTIFNLLKIDVQGAELLVLQGARSTLRGVDCVLLELAVIQFNTGAPLWLSVQARMAHLGFQIYDVLELHYLPTNKMLIQVDILFANTKSSLWNQTVTAYPRPDKWPLEPLPVAPRRVLWG